MKEGEIDIVSLAQTKTNKFKNKNPTQTWCHAHFNPATKIFKFSPESPRDAGDVRFVEQLRERGYVLFHLPERIPVKFEQLSQQIQKSVYDLPEQKKRKMAKVFRSSKEFKNYFSYGFLSGPGKETFRIRGINQKAKDSIVVPDLLYPDELFDAGYDLMEELHHSSLQSLRIISDNIPGVDKEYIFSHSELELQNPEQAEEPELSFSLSHMNMLRYYDPSKPVPVNQHTDQYLLTLIPLNSSNPSLEVWDFKDKEWIPIERNVKIQVPDAPCYSIGVVLVGETLSWITNDYFVSSLHRVVAPNKTARFSCPFFLSAQKNKILDPSQYIGHGKIFGPIENKQIPNDDQLGCVTPIELGNFLWECTQKPNETHETIQNRLNHSVTKSIK